MNFFQNILSLIPVVNKNQSITMYLCITTKSTSERSKDTYRNVVNIDNSLDNEQ
jgi:hypothetical protein